MSVAGSVEEHCGRVVTGGKVLARGREDDDGDGSRMTMKAMMMMGAINQESYFLVPLQRVFHLSLSWDSRRPIYVSYQYELHELCASQPDGMTPQTDIGLYIT